jgi:hypothetical protein
MQGKQIPVAVCFVVAMVILIENFFPGPLKTLSTQLVSWSLVLAAVAIILGVVNLIRINARKVARKSKGWGDSVLIFVGFALFTAVGLYGGGASYPLYTKLFNHIMSVFNQAFWGVVLFFIVSAAFRGFVARNWQAAIILISAIIVALGQVPIGDVMIPGISKVFVWLRDVPNLAGQRGIILGAAVGAITQQLRVIIGLERGHFGG